jgi:hypothetical protein
VDSRNPPHEKKRARIREKGRNKKQAPFLRGKMVVERKRKY